MPIYEYLCLHCGHRFEELKTLSQRHNAECPKCGHRAEKKMSSFAVTGCGCDSDGDASGSSGSCSCHSCGCGM